MVAIEDLLKPIAGQNPCGIYLRYETVYDKIREARRQDDGGAVIDGVPKTADHKAAVDLASEAIAKKSKDLQLAAWLADSLLYREGFAGLNGGLMLMREMLETYWENLYPEIEEDDVSLRTAPLDWLGSDPNLGKGSCPVMSVRFVPITATGLSWLHYHEKSQRDAKKERAEEFESAFQGTPKAFYKQQAADLASSIQSLDELAAACDQRFGKDGPSLSNLKRALEEVQNTVGILLKRKLEAEPDPVEVASPASAGSAAEGTPVTPTDGMAESALATSVTGLFAEFQGEIEGLEPKHQQEALVRIVAATRFMQRAQPANPAPYLILRAVRWGELRGGGPELDASLLVAPSTEVRTRMKTLAANKRWADLLALTESAAATECARGWLDLQRYAITACEQLGYTAAANAIKSELACLLADYPKLVSATLLDDTGTANPETAAWLSTALKKG
jgi:type VI secretion system protein ImpA